MPFVTCKFTGSSGEFEVNNIIDFDVRYWRTPSPNGHVGMKAFEIDPIRIYRHRSLQLDGVAQLEDDLVKLACSTEKKAYFDGELTLAQADDSGNKVITIRFTGGHIVDYQTSLKGEMIEDSFAISVPELTINNETIKRNPTV